MNRLAADAAADPPVCASLTYAQRDGQALRADFYAPAGDGPFPVVVAAPGGGWFISDPGGLARWARFLAERGFAVLAFQYRVSLLEKTFPKPVLDALDALRYVRRHAAELRIDPARIALLGSSAGAHVTALAALAGDHACFRDAAATDGPAPPVKAFVGIYGVYDLFALWQHELADAPQGRQRRSECSLGVSPYEDRQLYFDASPLSHVRQAVNTLPVFLAWGTADGVVPPSSQSLPFLHALRQAGFQVQECRVEGAGHYWFMDETFEDPGSYSAFLAPRLLRFLQRHV